MIGFTDTPPNAAGVAHDTIAAMQAGAAGAMRLETIGGLAFTFQSMVLVFAILFCVLSGSPAKRSPAFLSWMAVTYAVNILVWQQMYFGHQAFLEMGETGWLLGFPAATAWQVYRVWFAGVVLIAVYSAGFRHYVLSEDDELRFEELLRKFGDSRD